MTAIADSGELALATVAEGETRTLRLAVPGMHCGGCLYSVERTLRALPGVTEARANLSRKSVTVSWTGNATDGAAVTMAVREAGFDAFPIDGADAAEQEARENRDLLTRMAVAGFASANIMLLSVSVWSGAVDATRDLLHWISALIAMPVIVYSGRPFFASALRGLRAGRLNMDAPISLAVILAAAVSLSEVLRKGEDAYFDAAVMLLFLLLIGRWLDHVMRTRARGAARSLARLSPRGAWVIGADSARRYVASEGLRPDDLVMVDPGARVPVDGIVTEGSGTVDAALVTGESLPVPVEPGDRIEAGVMSLDSGLTIRATAAGEDTTLAETARLCAAAEDRKSQLAQLADRAAAIYAPTVHLIALVTLIGWLASGATLREAILASVAVLIVTCPCALGLAAPMAQAVASGALFRRGVMLKDGSALERLAKISQVVFDKTGVLTHAQLELTDTGGLDGEALQRAISLANRSAHPLAKALVRYGETIGVMPLAVTYLRETAGAGIEGQFERRTARLGSAAYCGAGAVYSDASECWYAEENIPAHRLAFADKLRPDVVKTVASFSEAGIPATILSGDRDGAVARIASETGIDAYEAELRPADKIARIEAMETTGPILMVGDGINDGPALAAASVSMAPASGSDIGRAAADMVFTGDSLAAITAAWHVARRTRRIILQNFALAAGYNVIAIPLAMLGHAGPLVAAIAMSSSSLLVTLNALRVNWGEKA